MSKNLSNTKGLSRGRNVRFYLIIQDFDQLKEKYRDQAGTIKSNCNNWLYLLTADNNTAQEISKRLGKYTIETSRSSVSNKLRSTEFNISNDKSLTGRELLTSDELMKFEFGEGLFMRTRMNPIKSNLPIIDDYSINFRLKEVEFPKLNKIIIEVFNLDDFRIEKKVLEDLNLSNENRSSKINLCKKILQIKIIEISISKNTDCNLEKKYRFVMMFVL